MSDWIELSEAGKPKPGVYLTHWTDGTIETFPFEDEVNEAGWDRNMGQSRITHYMGLPMAPEEYK